MLYIQFWQDRLTILLICFFDCKYKKLDNCLASGDLDGLYCGIVNFYSFHKVHRGKDGKPVKTNYISKKNLRKIDKQVLSKEKQSIKSSSSTHIARLRSALLQLFM